MRNKILQIISVDIFAVIKKENYCIAIPVVCLELVEEIFLNQKSIVTTIQRERAVVIKKGKLINTDEIPEFLGLVNKETDANALFNHSKEAFPDKD